MRERRRERGQKDLSLVAVHPERPRVAAIGLESGGTTRAAQTIIDRRPI